jgi:U3 small nucleolar RNA-associated protein 7
MTERTTMDALIASANKIHPLSRRRKASQSAPRKDQKSNSSDPVVNSITKQTKLPRSLLPNSPLPVTVPAHSHIANKKLRTRLKRTSAHVARSKLLLEDAELLLANEDGGMKVDGEMEKTWRVGQQEIVNAAGQEASKGRREWKLDGGPYRCRYTRNGRSVSTLHMRTRAFLRSVT